MLQISLLEFRAVRFYHHAVDIFIRIHSAFAMYGLLNGARGYSGLKFSFIAALSLCNFVHQVKLDSALVYDRRKYIKF
jgi:hypothetical protein